MGHMCRQDYVNGSPLGKSGKGQASKQEPREHAKMNGCDKDKRNPS